MSGLALLLDSLGRESSRSCILHSQPGRVAEEEDGPLPSLHLACAATPRSRPDSSLRQSIGRPTRPVATAGLCVSPP